MTQSEPSLPGAAEPQRAIVRPGTLLAWGAILACAVMIATPILPRPQRNGSAETWDPARIQSPSIGMISRYAVGVRAFVESTGSIELGAQIQAAAKSPLDELRAIMAIGELYGSERALAELERFESHHAIVYLRPDVDALKVVYSRGPGFLTAEQVQLLQTRHAWFGKLALSTGQPPGDSQRDEVLAQARRTMLVMIGLGVLVPVALLFGLALAIIAGVLAYKGHLRWAYRRPLPQEPAGVFAEGFAVYLASYFGLTLAGAWLLPGLGLRVAFGAVLTLILGLIWMRRRGLSWAGIRLGIGLTAGRGFWREAGAGVLGYLAGFPIFALGILITWTLMRSSGKVGQVSHPLQSMPMQTVGQMIEVFLLAAVVAPIVEELMFRGALFHHLRARWGWWVSAIVSSAIFAAIHPQGWIATPALASLAIVFCLLRQWRGSAIAPIVAHGLNNGVATLVIALTMQ